MLLFSFSIFSDPWSLKIENENNTTKTLTEKVTYMEQGSLEIRPWGYKTFFVLNSIQHEISNAHKYKNINSAFLGFR